MNISHVTTSIRQFFAKLTSAGIGWGKQLNTFRCNGQAPEPATHHTDFTGQLDKEFKSCWAYPLFSNRGLSG